MSFKAIYITKDDSKSNVEIASLEESSLPEGDVIVDVTFSTLNYKDALAITGKGPIVRSFPMVAGIDFAGVVRESSSSRFRAGDKVVHNGWGLGETRWGGLSQLARSKSEWLVPLPSPLSLRNAMELGTAGYTAMLCVLALENGGIAPGSDVLVTGATGGVGSVAVRLLAQRGYTVIASTGKSSEAEYLKQLGVSQIIDRNELSSPGRPLGKERWAAVVDTVGGYSLANACAATRYDGVVAACGMAQSLEFPGSVAPFILRGVKLVGIDSVFCPIERRLSAWAKLSEEFDQKAFSTISKEISLSETIDAAAHLMDGRIRGRILVNVSR